VDRLSSIKHLGVVALTVALAACGAAPGTGSSGPEMPVAISALIHDLETQPVRNPPALVARYEYGGQVVYYVPPHCCDFFGDLYDSKGQIICHPDGGIAGHGDGRCPDFAGRRTNEVIVWRDRRTGG
jgi:hypothetical protein